MKTLFIGIDPGQTGGIALIDAQYNAICVSPYNDQELIGVCRNLQGVENSVVCCLEKVGAMPGQGVTSMFNFGKSVGYIKGVLEAFGIPYQEVTPKKWKGEFSLNSNKAASAEVCKRLFPDISLLPTPKHKKPHDGMAEALLMAEYARRKF